MRFNTILGTIGDTPHIRINRPFDERVEVLMKAERTNPGGEYRCVAREEVLEAQTHMSGS